MKIILRLLIALFLSIFFNSCAIKPVILQELSCPPKEQDCMPNQWKGIVYDTSREYQQLSDSYYDFQCVKNLNSKNDEWAISFINPKDVLLTTSDGDRQYVMVGKMDNDLSGRISSGIGIPLDGNIGSFSVVGKDLVFACSKDDDNSVTGNANLYTGKISANIVFDVQNIPRPIYYNDYVWTSQPSISKNKDVIFFSSDRPGGNGGTDIWFSILLEDGRWSKPLNCGKNVNSRCDELTPFLTNNSKQLYFASSGFETVGGYDIFVAEINEMFWNDVQRKEISQSKVEQYFPKYTNLRPPLNTAADELYPSCPGDCNDLLYYSSNQFTLVNNPPDDKGGFDLFVRRKIIRKKADEKAEEKIVKVEKSDSLKVEAPDLLIPPVFINPIYTLEGKVYNARKRTPISNAEIYVKPTYKESLIKQDISKHKTEMDGTYSFPLEKGTEFEITAQAKDYFFDSFKLLVETTDTTSYFNKDFFIPEILTLRINFPTDIFDA
ncbi:MAG TPA: hypothetical protein PKY56_10865, partial [Candidatus Kapabacteria bacterium]|nr:hypothetical protein [Candidatus Kapabacteria bacterium]